VAIPWLAGYIWGSYLGGLHSVLRYAGWLSDPVGSAVRRAGMYAVGRRAARWSIPSGRFFETLDEFGLTEDRPAMESFYARQLHEGESEYAFQFVPYQTPLGPDLFEGTDLDWVEYTSVDRRYNYLHRIKVFYDDGEGNMQERFITLGSRVAQTRDALQDRAYELLTTGRMSEYYADEYPDREIVSIQHMFTMHHLDHPW